LSDIAKNALKPGTKAPLFSPPDATGNLISLTDTLSRDAVVLSDFDNQIARQYKIVFSQSETVAAVGKALGGQR